MSLQHVSSSDNQSIMHLGLDPQGEGYTTQITNVKQSWKTGSS